MSSWEISSIWEDTHSLLYQIESLMSRDIFLPESSAGVRTQACEIPAQTSSKPGQTERVLLADEFISLREKSGAIGKSNNLYRDRLRDFCCGPNGTLTRTYLVHLLISFTFELQIACSSRKALHKAISCLDFTSRSQLCYSNTAAAFLGRVTVRFKMKENIWNVTYVILYGGVSNARLRASLQSKHAV